jgi:hypothetical protein
VNTKQRSSKYYRFNILFFIYLWLPVVGISSFNIAIDPYGLFNTPVLAKFNKYKSERDKYLMLVKAAEVRQIKATVFFLGSSRVMSGLDTKHPALLGRSTYNLGLPGVNMYQTRKYLEHAIANQSKIEKVILGLDFFMFNSNLENLPDFQEKRLGKQFMFQDLLSSSFSINSLQTSWVTLNNNLNDPGRDSEEESITKRFNRWLTNFINYPGFYKNYSLSEARLNDLKTIIEICKNNNIEIKVFISPTHATDNEAIRISGLWSVFEDWKRKVVKITPVWDFSGYNSVTTESINDRMTNYRDNSHYSKKTGNLVLDRLLSHREPNIPQDFGVLLTSVNIKNYLAKVRSDRKVWTKNHADEVKLVETIKQKMDEKQDK